MKVTYDPNMNDFLVDGEPIRQFYIRMKKEAGITTTKLAMDSGVDRVRLYYLENRYTRAGSRGKYSNSLAPILAALETLSFNLELKG